MRTRTRIYLDPDTKTMAEGDAAAIGITRNLSRYLTYLIQKTHKEQLRALPKPKTQKKKLDR